LDDNTSGQNFHYTVTDYQGTHTTAEYVLADYACAASAAGDPKSVAGCQVTSLSGDPNLTDPVVKAVTPVSCPGNPLPKVGATEEPLCALAAYSPAVAFTNLHTVGADRSIAAVLLDQNGVQVSTPSVYTSDGFSVGYGSIVPTAP
jgi:hypothetical protein